MFSADISPDFNGRGMVSSDGGYDVYVEPPKNIQVTAKQESKFDAFYGDLT